MKIEDRINDDIQKYYSEKIYAYGPTPAGVGWNGEASQVLRFEQLLKIISKKNFSILDYGCGYGALNSFLINHFNADNFTYYGFDISNDMIKAAIKCNYDKAVFATELTENTQYDFSVSSGIFNLKPLHVSNKDWITYILEILQIMHKVSKHGFAFNILTIYSDKEKMKEELFYADPSFFFDYCKKHFSRNVALLHDYNLYEFTILVRKS